MGAAINLTTDHDEIRRWVDGIGGRPVQVRIGGADHGIGVPDLDLPGGTTLGHVEPITWDEWFALFDSTGLALLYDQENDGSPSAFTKLVQR